MNKKARTDSKLGGDREVLAQRLRNAIDQAIGELPDELIAYALSGHDEMGAVRKALGHDKKKIGKDEDADMRSVAVIRAVRAAFTASRSAPIERVMSAVMASTDIEVVGRLIGRDKLLAATDDGEIDTSAIGLTLAKRSALQERAGEMLSAPQVGKLLGISRQAVDKRRRSGKLLAVRLASDWRYPAVQFYNGAIPLLMEWVLQAYDDHDPWDVLEIIMKPREENGGQSLIQLVEQGDAGGIGRHIDALASQ